MGTWSSPAAVPPMPSIRTDKDPDMSTVKMMYDYLKTLSNVISQLRNDLEFMINGNLDARNIRAKSITADTLNVNELSAITANMGKLTSGEIYGAHIATRETGYPKVELDNQGNFLRAWNDANHYVTLETNLSGMPAFRFTDASTGHFATITMDNNEIDLLSSGISIQVSATGGDVRVSGNSVYLTGSNLFINGNTGFSGTVYVASTSGGAATTPIRFTNGIRTS